MNTETTTRVLITTCMKNEGPFILEWLAWHRAIGVTDIVVFTNDCSDGSDELLDHLTAKGYLVKMTNPAVEMGATTFQPIALAHTQSQILSKDHFDYVVSMDVDEFINVRIGSGRLDDLFDASGPFDVLTMSELNHGCNGLIDFEDCWLTETYTRHEKEKPGSRKARRGVKSIVKISKSLKRLKNHRPNTNPNAVWLDGSGRDNAMMRDDRSARGRDCRGCYDLVVLDQFALRSLHSYLIKMHRGDVVKSDRSVSPRYWRVRNRNGFQTSDMSRGSGLARQYYDTHFRQDHDLMALHEKCVVAHKDLIRKVLTVDDFIERKEWILANAWQDLA